MRGTMLMYEYLLYKDSSRLFYRHPDAIEVQTRGTKTRQLVKLPFDTFRLFYRSSGQSVLVVTGGDIWIGRHGDFKAAGLSLGYWDPSHVVKGTANLLVLCVTYNKDVSQVNEPLVASRTFDALKTYSISWKTGDLVTENRFVRGTPYSEAGRIRWLLPETEDGKVMAYKIFDESRTKLLRKAKWSAKWNRKFFGIP